MAVDQSVRLKGMNRAGAETLGVDGLEQVKGFPVIYRQLSFQQRRGQGPTIQSKFRV